MSRRRGGGGRRRYSLWTVLIPGASAPPDQDGRTINVRAQAHTFSNKQRAKRFAGNIQGARVVPTKRFWSFKRVVVAVVLVVLVVVFCF